MKDCHDNVAKRFTNYTTGDNPSKYKNEIVSIIDDLLDNRFNELTENDIENLYLIKKDSKFKLFKDAINYMLENKVKLEQEALD